MKDVKLKIFQMIHLDTIDKELLHFLQEDCKQTNKELSNKLNLSVTAVYERIKSWSAQVLFQIMSL